MIYPIQSKTHLISSSTTLSATLDNKPQYGNVLIAAISTYNGNGGDSTVSSIVQNGATWTRQKQRRSIDNKIDVEIWLGTVNNNSASQNFTITVPQSPTQGIIADIVEYSGVSSIDGSGNVNFTLDVTGTGNGLSPTTSTGTSSGQTNGQYREELWVGAIFQYAYGQTSPTNNFYLYDGQQYYTNSLAFLEKKVYDNKNNPRYASSGTTCVPPYNFGSQEWYGCIATFKGSSVYSDDTTPPINYNCCESTGNESQGQGGKAVTIWGPADVYLPPNTDVPLQFTCTQPKCYISKDSCNLTYTIQIDSSTANPDFGPINLWLNGEQMGDRFHSKIQGHDITETIDLAPIESYKDDASNGPNILTFRNAHPGLAGIGATLKNLTIVRVYGMKGFDQEDVGQCANEVSTSGSSDFASRVDYPCNRENCGSRLSFSGFGKDDHVKMISLNEPVTWSWTNPQPTIFRGTSNYLGPKSCLFNLNNIAIDNESSTNDVPFTISINGSPQVYFYHSKLNRHQGVGVDFATHPTLANYYHDTPGSTNTVTLTNNSSTTKLVLCDGTYDGVACPPACSTAGNINIYRIYFTANNCPDNFDNDTIDDRVWDKLEVNGGSTNQSNNDRLEVTVQSGTGYAQAGYVTKYAHDMSGSASTANATGLTADVGIPQFSYLGEMTLEISPDDKTYQSDPDSLSNYYRILKYRYGQNRVIVQRKVNGVKQTLLSTSWVGQTGGLSIEVRSGYIYFYDNGYLMYSEPYALSSYNCYVYIFTSTDRSVYSGTDAFDNFNLRPNLT
jgi:hypothetical protein